jgi:hypothetical protein
MVHRPQAAAGFRKPYLSREKIKNRGGPPETLASIHENSDLNTACLSPPQRLQQRQRGHLIHRQINGRMSLFHQAHDRQLKTLFARKYSVNLRQRHRSFQQDDQSYF